MKRIKNKGFTLVELLVVISIIGLLSTIILVTVQDTRDKANNTKKNQLVGQYLRAAELYRDKYDTYPDDTSKTVNYDWCLGPYSTGKCYGGFIDYSAVLASSFSEFISGPPADNTFIPYPGGSGNRNGILYNCSARLNGTTGPCTKYRFAWALIGTKTGCISGATLGLIGNNRLCYLSSN